MENTRSDLYILKQITGLLSSEGMIAAHEEARKQLELTNLQQEKVEEAKTLIRDADIIRAEFAKREEELSAAKKVHEQFVNESIAELKEREKSIIDSHAELKTSQDELKTWETRIREVLNGS